MVGKEQGASVNRARRAKRGPEKPAASKLPDGPRQVLEGPKEKVPAILEQAAYHEAGHFVASMHLRRRVVGRVSIVPDVEKGILGVVHHGRFDSLFERLEYADQEDRGFRSRIEREIIIWLAGRAAEVVFLKPGDPAGSAGYLESAMILASRLYPRQEEAEAFVAWLKFRAEYVLDLPHNRPAVEALARALIERREVTARQARALVESTDTGRRELVKEFREAGRKNRDKRQK